MLRKSTVVSIVIDGALRGGAATDVSSDFDCPEASDIVCRRKPSRRKRVVYLSPSPTCQDPMTYRSVRRHLELYDMANSDLCAAINCLGGSSGFT